MKKIVYKSIFSIVIVLFAFLMLPNKQVKAQEEQTFPEVIMKVPYYFASHENTYTFTYEFIIQYRIDNLIYPFNDDLNEYEYFLALKPGLPMQKGITSTSLAAAYELEDIQIEDNYTIFFVRLILSKTIVDNQYFGIENMLTFFRDDSAFYIKYDVYQYGYDLGYMVGYGDGYNLGLEDGYWNGHNDGYDYGYNVGYDDGENAGYVIGYNEGYDYGYNVGYNDAYEEINPNEKYTQGYNDGFRAGEKSKIAQNSETFYKNIEKWLVPAIITVIIVGGIVSIIAIKRREQ